MFKTTFVFCLTTSILLFNCQTPNEKTQKEVSYPKKVVKQMNYTTIPLDSFQTLKINGHWVDIRSPKGLVKGNILVLPGWNFPRQDWCEKSSLCQKALAKGYRLIMPEMAKSVYATQLYPETRKDWLSYPTKTWLIKEMIPYLQEKYAILLKNQQNYLLGLSTGARGVALVALAQPDLFQACAALSGDYEQSLMPTDNLMIGFYGTYQQFPDRWNGEDNPCKQAKNFKIPIYLGHGKQDKIVPVQQTMVFYEALKKNQPQLKIKLNLTEAAHDYAYWNSEVENMLNFFEEE